MNAEYLVISAV